MRKAVVDNRGGTGHVNGGLIEVAQSPILNSIARNRDVGGVDVDAPSLGVAYDVVRDANASDDVAGDADADAATTFHEVANYATGPHVPAGNYRADIERYRAGVTRGEPGIEDSVVADVVAEAGIDLDRAFVVG